MSIAAQSIGEAPVSAHGSGASPKPGKTPRTRQIAAKADAVVRPEAR